MNTYNKQCQDTYSITTRNRLDLCNDGFVANEGVVALLEGAPLMIKGAKVILRVLLRPETSEVAYSFTPLRFLLAHSLNDNGDDG